ncbi:hypothetical protein FHS34_001154 [Streptomyces echinatus]|uniref:Uncharacterized protein n=1 Tax=Streptomyces echinatus TaxID=67293 RepID=A0A7W9PPY2_9ACTN|nr:hypothetical protein [Streptomyces echinatus]
MGGSERTTGNGFAPAVTLASHPITLVPWGDTHFLRKGGC